MRRAIIILIAVLALASATTASGTDRRPLRSCWQVRIVFVNYPPGQPAFARWWVTQGSTRVPGGEFSFHAGPSGGAFRQYSFCTINLNPWRPVRAHVKSVYFAPCSACRLLIGIRQKP